MIDVKQTTAKPERHVHLEGLAVRGRAIVGGERLGARVVLDEALEPLEAALAVRLEAAGQEDSRRADIDLSLGEAKLVAHARMTTRSTWRCGSNRSTFRPTWWPRSCRATRCRSRRT